MAELRLLSLSGDTGSPQLRLIRLSGSTTVALGTNQLRLLRLSGTTTGAATANAGPDLVNVEPFNVITLDGSTSVFGTSFVWSQTAGSPVTIVNATSSDGIATFVSPSDRTGGTLTFQLTVNGSFTDTMTISYLPQPEWYYNGSAWKPIRSLN